MFLIKILFIKNLKSFLKIYYLLKLSQCWTHCITIPTYLFLVSENKIDSVPFGNGWRLEKCDMESYPIFWFVRISNNIDHLTNFLDIAVAAHSVMVVCSAYHVVCFFVVVCCSEPVDFNWPSVFVREWIDHLITFPFFITEFFINSSV